MTRSSSLFSGCYFHPRCRFAQDICRQEGPALRDIRNGHVVACHLSEQLALRGVVGAYG